MKTKLITSEGKSGKEIELPSIFSGKIREDICQKYFEVLKNIQPYSKFPFAGMLYSAAGKIKHGRRLWKTAYGKGISRVPRKIMWRRGTQFYWIGATVSGTRGGRKAHAPKQERWLAEKKINKKERKIAIQSALIATTLPEYIQERYSSFENKKISIDLPLVVDSEVLKLKTKNFFKLLQNVLGELYNIAIQTKKTRAGVGKRRGRRSKKSAGLIFIIGKNENFKISGIETKKVNELNVKDLWPLGRLTVYSETAIKEIGEKWHK